jgi:hypothetical protein
MSLVLVIDCFEYRNTRDTAIEIDDDSSEDASCDAMQQSQDPETSSLALEEPSPAPHSGMDVECLSWARADSLGEMVDSDWIDAL